MTFGENKRSLRSSYRKISRYPVSFPSAYLLRFVRIKFAARARQTVEREKRRVEEKKKKKAKMKKYRRQAGLSFVSIVMAVGIATDVHGRLLEPRLLGRRLVGQPGEGGAGGRRRGRQPTGALERRVRVRGHVASRRCVRCKTRREKGLDFLLVRVFFFHCFLICSAEG